MQQLPLELREMIWELCLPTIKTSCLPILRPPFEYIRKPIPIIKAVFPGAAIVQACREFRRVALKKSRKNVIRFLEIARRVVSEPLNYGIEFYMALSLCHDSEAKLFDIDALVDCYTAPRVDMVMRFRIQHLVGFLFPGAQQQFVTVTWGPHVVESTEENRQEKGRRENSFSSCGV